MRIVRLLIALCGVVFAGTLVVALPAQAPDDKCAALSGLSIPNATVSSAKAYAAGTFSGPPQNFTGADLTAFYSKLPAFCQVMVDAKPTADSDIKIEVWMPLDGWNGRLQGLGNGGFAGLIDHSELGAGITRGYAATATDTGHAGSPIDATWAPGHPEKVADFGHRGIHEMTRVAKLVVEKFYGSAPGHSYFAGCSDGGREALMEAQRYPGDYDGILAGAPANYWTALLSLGAVVTQKLSEGADSFIPQAKIPAIAKAVIAQCDKQDGVADGILNDPRQCKFDPASMACKAGENTDQCLTAAQVSTLKTIYGGREGRAWNGRLSRISAGWGTGRWRVGNLDHRTGAGEGPDGLFCQWLLLRHGVREEGLGREVVQCGLGHEGGDPKDRRGAERYECRPERVSLPRRQAHPFSRMERSGDSRAEHGELLRGSGRQGGPGHS